MIIRVLTGALALMALVQVGKMTRQATAKPYPNPVQGQILSWPITPLETSRSLKLGPTAPGGCTQIFVCTLQCSACRRMVEAVRDDGVEREIVFLGEHRQVRRYLDSLQVPLGSISVLDHYDDRRIRDLRLGGTPLRLVTDNRRTVTHAKITPDATDQKTLATLCESPADGGNGGSVTQADQVTVSQPVGETALRSEIRYSVAAELAEARSIADMTVLADGRIGMLASEDGRWRISIVVREAGEVWASDSIPFKPLSVLDWGGNLAVWAPQSGEVWVYGESPEPAEVLRPFEPHDISDDIEGGLSAPLWPRRRHGRLTRVGNALFIEARPREQQALGPILQAQLLRFSPDSQVDTLQAFPAPTNSIGEGAGRRCCGFPKVFDSQPSWGFTPAGGLVLSAAGQSGFQEFSSTNELVRSVSWPSRASQVTDDDILGHYTAYTLDHVEAAATADHKAFLLESFKKLWDRNTAFFGTVVPDHRGLRVSADGRIWVRGTDTTRPFGYSTEWRRYDRTGNAFDRVEIDDMFEYFWSDGTEILGSVLTNGREKLVLFAPAAR